MHCLMPNPLAMLSATLEVILSAVRAQCLKQVYPQWFVQRLRQFSTVLLSMLEANLTAAVSAMLGNTQSKFGCSAYCNA